ncbi:MAG: tRNA (adenosine(37)-N6)-dimethylallyltransferase MiaA [Planctomycetota bacterium]
MTALFAVLAGPTASGKSDIAVAIAGDLGAELISMDSMQVYRGMDIGTGKPGPAERAGVPHHLIDVADPREPFNTGEWIRLSEETAAGIRSRGRLPLFVGGTMLYLKALAEGLFDGPPAVPELRRRLKQESEREGPGALHARLAVVDPTAAARIHPGDARRIVRALEVYEATGRPWSSQACQWGRGPKPGIRAVAILRGRPELDRRIAGRVDRMFKAGWVEEVRTLLAARSLGPTARSALGYREIAECLEGRVPFEGIQERIARRTRRFARKQEMWIRSMRWLEVISVEGEASDAREAVLAALKKDPGFPGVDSA